MSYFIGASTRGPRTLVNVCKTTRSSRIGVLPDDSTLLNAGDAIVSYETRHGEVQWKILLPL